MYSELIGNYKKYRIKSLYGNILTINSLANQMRILENNMSEISLVLGQLFVPLMEKALPVVNGLTIAIKNLLVNLAGILGIEIDPNKFGQGFTAIEDDLDGITEETNDATEALEEYKNQLLGFDEVNKLQDQDVTATLGTNTDEIDLTEEILAATEEYEKFWQQAYDEMDNLADEWAKYFEKFTKPIEKIFEDIKIGDYVSLGEDVSGLAVDFTNFLKNAVNKIDWDDVGEFAGQFFTGALTVAFGGLGKGTSLVFDVGEGIAKFLRSAIDNIGFGDLAGAILYGIGSSIKESVTGTFDIWNALFGLSSGEEFTAPDLNIIANYEQAKKEGKDLQEWLKSMNEDVLQSGFGEYAYLDILSQKYFELAEKANLTAKEEEDLAKYRQQLIDSSEEIADILSNETTSYGEQAEAIKNVIDNLKEKAIQQAASGKLTELYQEQIEKAEDVADAESELTKITNKRTIAENKKIRILDKLAKAQADMDKAWRNDEEAYLQARIAVGEYKGELALVDAEIEKLTEEQTIAAGTVNELKTQYNSLTEQISLYADVAAGIKDANDIIKSSNENLVKSYEEAEADIETAFGNIKNAFSKGNWDAMIQHARQVIDDEFSNINYTIGFNVEIKTPSGNKTDAETVASYLVGANEEDVEELNKFLAIKNKWGIKAFWNGGFPKEEDGLFMANHNELVGKFANGKTAVANSYQIEAGIEQASYRGMARALAEHSGNGGNVTVVLQGDADGLFRVVQTKANSYTQQTGQPAFII